MNQNIAITDICWAAGLIDGEGCISIHKRNPIAKRREGHSPYYRLDLKVKMIHKPAIERLMTIFGTVHLHTELPAKLSKRVAWKWTVTGKECVEILKLIRPYLTVKANEADIAFEFVPVGQRSVYGNQKVPTEILNRREELYQKMKIAKQYEWTL